MMKKTLLATALSLGIGGLAYAAGGPAFEDVDANDDGQISQQEAQAIEGIDFSTADTNGDGQLSRSEFDTAHKGAAGTMGGHPDAGLREPGAAGGVPDPEAMP